MLTITLKENESFLLTGPDGGYVGRVVFLHKSGRELCRLAIDAPGLGINREHGTTAAERPTVRRPEPEPYEAPVKLTGRRKRA